MDDATADNASRLLNLKQAAAILDVHYMTVYRYVRQGKLDAHREGTQWRVTTEAISAFAARPPVGPATDGTADVGDGRRIDWAERLVSSLVDGDEPTAWRIIDQALAAGMDPTSCYLDMIASAVARVDAGTTKGRYPPASQPVATVLAQRLVARLGARFRRPGRSRGSVVLGAPSGELHQLPILILADLIRLDGFSVVELGVDVSADAFAEAARSTNRLVVTAIGITTTDHLDAATLTIDTVRAAAPTVPIMVGGQAVRNPAIAELLNADAWAPDGRSAVAAVRALAIGDSPIGAGSTASKPQKSMPPTTNTRLTPWANHPLQEHSAPT